MPNHISLFRPTHCHKYSFMWNHTEESMIYIKGLWIHYIAYI